MVHCINLYNKSGALPPNYGHSNNGLGSTFSVAASHSPCKAGDGNRHQFHFSRKSPPCIGSAFSTHTHKSVCRAKMALLVPSLPSLCPFCALPFIRQAPKSLRECMVHTKTPGDRCWSTGLLCTAGFMAVRYEKCVCKE